MSEKAKKSIVIILKTFFGFKQGQTLQEFNAELKALSAEEKMWMATEAAKQLDCEVADRVAA
jgi:hypothetical protein